VGQHSGGLDFHVDHNHHLLLGHLGARGLRGCPVGRHSRHRGDQQSLRLEGHPAAGQECAEHGHVVLDRYRALGPGLR